MNNGYLSGWIKMFRTMQQWEYYKNSHMVHLMLHLCMTANIEEKMWRGVTIRRGQRLASKRELSLETGIKYETIKTTLRRLQECGSITIQSTNAYSIITINNYESYQGENFETPQQLPNRTPNVLPNWTPNVLPTTKELKNIIISHSHTPRTREGGLNEEIEDAWLASAISNRTWIEAVMMRHHLTEEMMQAKWKEFVLDCQASNKQHHSERDVQEHYNRWLTINLQNKYEYNKKSGLERRRSHEVSHTGTEDYTETF